MTTKLHLAVEQRQKPMSIVITAGQRGDSPQFEPVLEKVRVPRIGPGRPRTRPNRVRADKAYASRKNRAYLRRRGIRCTIPDKADQTRNRKSAVLAAAGHRSSTRLTTVSATRSNAASTASRGTGPGPRGTTSWLCATRQPYRSLRSTSGCDLRRQVRLRRATARNSALNGSRRSARLPSSRSCQTT
ncbi:transposase [Streptomyces sp. Root264]|uniref:transposase n=1 Tax=Streptomyces sp. Root264 TaxID=1736503 RepID=UPI00351AACB3